MCRLKLEEMMLREAQFGGQELFFGEGGYLDKVGMTKFGKKTASGAGHNHDHDHDGHHHEDHHHEDNSGNEGQA
jgi:trigger factor